jgi:hypothetical protein
MSTILVGTVAATLVGCRCVFQPQTLVQSSTEANGLPCFDRRVSSQMIEAKSASFKANSKSEKAAIKIAAKTQTRSADGDRHKPYRRATSP